MTIQFKHVLASHLCMIVAACGGSSAPQATPPVNMVPIFATGTGVVVNEDTADAIYTVEATDPDGDALTYSLLSTKDSKAFAFDPATRQLRFDPVPDFETPRDLDGDNVYEITFRVDDGMGGQADLDLNISVRDVIQIFGLKRVGTGFTQPVYLESLPDDSGRMVVVEKGGRLRLLDPDTGIIDSVDFLDATAEVSTNGERGVLGLVFSPDYTTDGTFYINITNLAGDTEIRRYETMAGRLDIADPTTSDIILTIAQPASNHNAGWIGIDASGFLVIPTGDGGGSGDPNNLSQDTTSLLGKVLRLDITSDDFPADDLRDYGIPPGNTFAGNPAAGREEIFAIGLRNPYRASFDPVSGDLLIGDVGQASLEEIDRLPMDDPSYNFGWSVREGTQSFKGADQPEFTPPVTEYPRGEGPLEGRSVTGGHVYTGSVEDLRGEYIFADFVSGNVWSVPVIRLLDGQTLPASEFTIRNDDFLPDQGDLRRVTSFGIDADNDLYIVTILGDVFRLEVLSQSN